MLQSAQSFFERNSQIVLSLLVLGLGVGSVVYGVGHIRQSINAPFARNGEAAAVGSSNDLLAAATADTDQDGLLDQDELNVYKTSPYIADTDSDGLTDAKEIEAGSDPNCPAGQTCATAVGEVATGGDQSAAPSSLTVQDLRAILITSGFPEENVNKLSDQEIVVLLQKVTTSNGNISPDDLPPALLGTTTVPTDVTPAQLRQILLQNGMTEQDLVGVTDGQLMELFRETVSETQKTSP